ncbi:50S ribosomal protein L25/general stress protein Ctc [Gilvimarinus agarilyticus]|uniref:50S ribosomal protein L25/general stress protein Ctc n=1 Tax=unclassified Gilvimarinus TaxID=2642066 RepID=UPI001C087761|nr:MULTISPECIES: 50S ribosomal protein L25/general stress protein Ctc [unclassified Gilvimarinus]MBU2886079.1 50S ribosomal protein L25/general stress protein Ctc [Gilvimarinus agarilyticus]MDO6570788.1 50S ribosomal protein L25/general stress protein Ctc [Gilvimarinus sp. 2_MG-2023]MDO6746956.1 50S ribosomal protein L25/general stress protein Ctc [Gilvimarinus sp. 1_MG-2023]
MSEDFVIIAKSREDKGKGASRRLRRLAGEVPAIVYGGKKKPVSITLNQKDLLKQLENEAFYSHIISLEIDDKAEDVILKDLQRHPAKPILFHVDFMRVSKTKKLNTSVPLHFLNEEACKGVKMQGGKIVHNMVQLEISCLPADLPEFIEVDLTDVELGQVVHISDLNLPKGVVSVELSHGSDHDQPVVTVNKPKGMSEDDAESSEAEGEGDSE